MGPRRDYLKPKDFTKHGHTLSCASCHRMQTGLGAKRGHNEECRTSMETAMASDETDKARIEPRKTKLDAYAAAEGERLLHRDGNVRGDAGAGKAQNTIAQMPEREIGQGQASSSIEDAKDHVEENASYSIRTGDPSASIDIGLPSPVRKKAILRSSPGVHDEETDLKVIICDDGEVENIDMRHEATHLEICSPREHRPTRKWLRLHRPAFHVHFPDPDIAMTSLISLDKYVISRGFSWSRHV